VRSRRACRQESSATTSGAGDRRRRRWTPLHRELGERPPAREGRGADHRRQPSTHTRCTTPGGGGDGPGEGSATHAHAYVNQRRRRRRAIRRTERRDTAHRSSLLAPSQDPHSRRATREAPAGSWSRAGRQRAARRRAHAAAAPSIGRAPTLATRACSRATRSNARAARTGPPAAAARPTRRHRPRRAWRRRTRGGPLRRQRE
jgi:hypothetical protein